MDKKLPNKARHKKHKKAKALLRVYLLKISKR